MESAKVQSCFFLQHAYFKIHFSKQKGYNPHPARYPAGLPEFFIKFLTEKDDLVLDPFAGSNVTGMVSETLERKWIAIDTVEEYIEASKFRFNGIEDSLPLRPPLKLVKFEKIVSRVAHT